MTETPTEVRPETKYTEPGDDEKFAHYVNKNAQMESIMTGKPVKALCGKVWTPTRDPEKFPICPDCKEIYSHIPE